MLSAESIETLLALLERERTERDQALLGAREAEGLASRNAAQAQQLLDYRGEYLQRWSSRFRTQGSIELVQCYQGFMQRLEQAIHQQRLVAEQAQARLRCARDALRERELRVGSVEKLIERRRRELQRRAARQEQSQSDEAAQRSHARRRLAHHDAPGVDPPR
jgi:flagellar protein FliJ